MSLSTAELVVEAAGVVPWSLAEIMRARSIAIVGASKAELSEMKLTGRPLKFIRMHGFTGTVVAVNPKYAELDGYPCYPSIGAIPCDIEVAALMVAKPRVREAVEECGKKGIRAALIFSSGFAELGEEGKRDEEELAAIARRYGMRLLGPNAAGLVSAANDMVLSFLTAFGQGALPRGCVSFASNSGALLSTGVRLADERKFGFSQLGSIGNEADLSLSDFVSAGASDPQTRVITAFVESIKDGAGLVAAAREAASGRKPVVILKVGSSERGGMVAASHTGAITGDDRMMSAVFEQHGITRVRDLTELADMASLFSTFDVPKETAAAIVSTGSGGAAELMADLCDRYGVRLADFGDLREELGPLLTPFSILVNPIDIAGMTSDFNEEHRLFRKAMEFLLRRDEIGIFGIVIPVLPYMTTLAEHIVDLVKNSDKPIIPIMMGGGDYPVCADIFRKAGVPFLPTADQGARALKLFQAYAEFQSRLRAGGGPIRHAVGDRKVKAIAMLKAHGRAHRTMTLHHAAPLLALYGLGLPEQRLARSADDAVRFAADIGFPVVMKVESPKILHKTEIGGVRVGVAQADAVRSAFAELSAAAARVVPADDVDGILVQPVVPYETEFILGSTRARGLGHVMVAGLGGVWVELLKDVAMRMPPVDADEARRMIHETKAGVLLAGYRGKPPADEAALAAAIVAFSELVHDLGDYVDEIEINPIFVMRDGNGVLVGDALIMLGDRAR